MKKLPNGSDELAMYLTLKKWARRLRQERAKVVFKHHPDFTTKPHEARYELECEGVILSCRFTAR